MPELPDLVALQRYLESTSLHQPIELVAVLDDRILDDTSAQALGRKLKGASFESARRHGKLLFAESSEGVWVVFHFGMTGNLHYAAGGEPPEYAKVVFHFANGAHLAYVCWRMLGRVGWRDSPEAVIQDEGLGPDALSDAVDQDAFLQMLEGRRGAVKSLLMDQETLAGLGNVYSDEVLYHARIRPGRPVSDIPEKERRKLFRAMKKVLSKCEEVGGDARKLPKRSYLIRHRDDDAQCPRCGGALQTGKVGGRTARFCPTCQE